MKVHLKQKLKKELKQQQQANRNSNRRNRQLASSSSAQVLQQTGAGPVGRNSPRDPNSTLTNCNSNSSSKIADPAGQNQSNNLGSKRHSKQQVKHEQVIGVSGKSNLSNNSTNTNNLDNRDRPDAANGQQQHQHQQQHHQQSHQHLQQQHQQHNSSAKMPSSDGGMRAQMSPILAPSSHQHQQTSVSAFLAPAACLVTVAQQSQNEPQSLADAMSHSSQNVARHALDHQLISHNQQQQQVQQPFTFPPVQVSHGYPGGSNHQSQQYVADTNRQQYSQLAHERSQQLQNSHRLLDGQHSHVSTSLPQEAHEHHQLLHESQQQMRLQHPQLSHQSHEQQLTSSPLYHQHHQQHNDPQQQYLHHCQGQAAQLSQQHSQQQQQQQQHCQSIPQQQQTPLNQEALTLDNQIPYSLGIMHQSNLQPQTQTTQQGVMELNQHNLGPPMNQPFMLITVPTGDLAGSLQPITQQHSGQQQILNPHHSPQNNRVLTLQQYHGHLQPPSSTFLPQQLDSSQHHTHLQFQSHLQQQ